MDYTSHSESQSRTAAQAQAARHDGGGEWKGGGEERKNTSGTFRMLSCTSRCARLPTSSRVSMAEPGVVAAVLAVVLGAVPEELTESISPATSWISRARMARSLARSWLILRTQGNNL